MTNNDILRRIRYTLDLNDASMIEIFGLGDFIAKRSDVSNNLILRKLKIAFDLKTDEIIELFNLVEKKISPHELSAFLRSPEQKQYRHCNDQYLRNFIHGLQVKFRNNANEPE